MHVVLAWLSDHPLPDRERQARFDRAVADLVADTFVRHDFGGADWGVTVLHHSRQEPYRWPVVATDADVTAVSLGLPVGIDVPDGPGGLARRLLTGRDVHAGVVPPFGLLALDGDRRLAVQQDWLGMCRLFTGEAGGVTAWCSRPSLLATFLYGTPAPDPEGWSSYVMCGHFGGEFSPVRGARLMRPGERTTGERGPGGGWQTRTELRHSVDDVVRAGIEAQGRPLDETLDLAAEGFTGTARSVDALYGADIALGLSGGKDSRLIAASLIAAGQLPRLFTNDDLAAEGEVARQLVEILRDKRGLSPEHRVVPAAAPANILRTGLHERITRLQRRYDYQFPSTYTVRAPGADRLLDVTPVASLTGAGGELATGYWYPPADRPEPRTGRQEGLARLLSAVPGSAAAESAVTQERDRIGALVDHGESLGVEGLHLVDYLYLVERVRKWYTSAYAIGMVTPFLSPAFVTASFALTPEQKRQRVVHSGLLLRLLPEWAEVPYVSAASGKSTATRVWEGDGVQVISDLLDTARGPLAGLIRRDAVHRGLVACGRGAGASHQKTLQQFAWLAVASHRLEPDTVGPATGETYAAVTRPAAPREPARPALPPLVSSVVRRARFVKKTRLGRRIWGAVRSRAVRRAGKGRR